VHRIGVWGKEVPYDERIARQARQLLHCFGIVTRASLENWEATNLDEGWDWPALYGHLQGLEMRGEVRRGYFVQGLPGVQFALPEAVERLREWSRPEAAGGDALVLLNACDPANLFGPALPSAVETDPDPARFVRIPANYVVLLRGRPVLLLEPGAQRVTALPDLPEAAAQRALALAVEQVAGGVRRLSLSLWNGAPIVDSPAAPLLEGVGFRREALEYVWDG
jgi:ATP-dependent Lhr-like helicase